MTLPAALVDKNVCIIGLGYVGLTLAVAMSDTGFRVHGIEKQANVLEGLSKNEPHFWEPRLEEKLARVSANGQFTFSEKMDPKIPSSVYIITVGTPLDRDGNARLDMVQNATRQVTEHMQDNALIILRSTVKLGTARNVIEPILKESGKPYQLAFCPERTLEGRALIELHELPQVIGADDPDTRWRCQQLFGQMTPTTVAVTSLETAELVKLVDNTYRDLSFGFANEIAKLCSHVGISASEVIKSGRLGYPRTQVALPGPVGGPCLEKDPHILVESAKQWGVSMPITHAGRNTNENQPLEIATILKRRANMTTAFPDAPVISLLGLAFKGQPATDDLRGTMAMPIYRALKQAFPNGKFRGYDPVAKPEAVEDFFKFSTVSSIDEAFTNANIVMILNNHKSFQEMELVAHGRQMSELGIIYDLWNMHGDVNVDDLNNIQFLALGAENINPA